MVSDSNTNGFSAILTNVAVTLYQQGAELTVLAGCTTFPTISQFTTPDESWTAHTGYRLSKTKAGEEEQVVNNGEDAEGEIKNVKKKTL